jgi:hypothetical protein
MGGATENLTLSDFSVSPENASANQNSNCINSVNDYENGVAKLELQMKGKAADASIRADDHNQGI